MYIIEVNEGATVNLTQDDLGLLAFACGAASKELCDFAETNEWTIHVHDYLTTLKSALSAAGLLALRQAWGHDPEKLASELKRLRLDGLDPQAVREGQVETA